MPTRDTFPPIIIKSKLMAEEFNEERAQSEIAEIVSEARGIRDDLSRDVISYYSDRSPDNEDEEREYRAGLRKYLIIAEERIHSLIERKL